MSSLVFNEPLINCLCNHSDWAWCAQITLLTDSQRIFIRQLVGFMIFIATNKKGDMSFV